jgi:hypothetical protein
VPRPVTARVIVMSFDLRVAVKGVAPSNRRGWQFNTIRARFGRSSVKDPNWSHPGKSTSYPRRSIPVTNVDRPKRLIWVGPSRSVAREARSGIGALQPLADDAAHGRRCPIPAIARCQPRPDGSGG